MKLLKPKHDWYDKLNTENTHEKSQYLERKRASLIKSYEEPVLPTLCKILFIGMLVLTVIMVFLELASYHRYGQDLTIHHLFVNLSTSGLLSWASCGIFLILSSFLGIRINIKNYWGKKASDCISIQTDEDKKRNKRAIHRLNAIYTFYLRVTILGYLIWLIFYLLIVYIF